MKILFIPLFIISCISLSCDPSSQYSRIIKNSSSYEILVIKKNYPICDTIAIGLEEEYLVYQRGGLHSTSKYEDCTILNDQADTFLLQVKGDTSLSINADVFSNKNWYFSKTKKSMKGGGICNCKLTITNDLIQ